MASLLHQAILSWASLHMAFLVMQKKQGGIIFIYLSCTGQKVSLCNYCCFELHGLKSKVLSWHRCDTQLNQFLLSLVWYFLTSSQKLLPLRKGKKTDESVKGLFRLLTHIHVLLDFLAVSTDGQWLRLQDTDRGEISIHITVLFRPSQGVRSNHTNTISPHYKQGRWREEELGSSAWWQASCVSTACNWHNVNSKTFGTVRCYQD